jgi:hypothetical protein
MALNPSQVSDIILQEVISCLGDCCNRYAIRMVAPSKPAADCSMISVYPLQMFNTSTNCISDASMSFGIMLNLCCAANPDAGLTSDYVVEIGDFANNLMDDAWTLFQCFICRRDDIGRAIADTVCDDFMVSDLKFNNLQGLCASAEFIVSVPMPVCC